MNLLTFVAYAWLATVLFAAIVARKSGIPLMRLLGPVKTFAGYAFQMVAPQ